jgi:DNA-binding MarR family transcriptional regulator
MTGHQAPHARDLEAIVHGAPENHKAELRLWLRLLSATNLISAEVRRRLRAEFGVTLPRFDLLAQLDRESEGLRLGELSRRMMVTNGNVTGLVERLTKEGLIRRRAVDGDRRVGMVTLTPAGRAAFARMAAAHEMWLAELLADLDPVAIDALMKRLAALKHSVAARATIAPRPPKGGREAGKGD